MRRLRGAGLGAAIPGLAGLASVVGLATPASASTRARQGTFEVSLAPIQDARTMDAYYAYNTTQASSAATGLEVMRTSILFLHQHPSTGALSFALINDIFNNGLGGAASFTLTGLPAAATYIVRDDPFDSFVPDPPAGGQSVVGLSWSTCCTDGFAVTGLETEPSCIAIAPTFTSGINLWQLLAGPFPPVTRINLPNLTDTVYLCTDCHAFTCPDEVLAESCDPTGADLVVTSSGGSLCGGDVVTNDRTAGGADASDRYPAGTTTVTFTLVDVAGFRSTCQTQVIVSAGLDAIPPDQGNVLRQVRQDDDVVLGWGATGASDWRVYRDDVKTQLGATNLSPDLTGTTFVDTGRVPPVGGVPVDFYRVKGLSPCTFTPGP
jgi:hypothetical protein